MYDGLGAIPPYSEDDELELPPAVSDVDGG